MLNVSSLVSRIQGLELNAMRHSKLYTLNSKLLACKVNNFLSNKRYISLLFYIIMNYFAIAYPNAINNNPTPMLATK